MRRLLCEKPGCKNKRSLDQIKNGRRYYKKFCRKHHIAQYPGMVTKDKEHVIKWFKNHPEYPAFYRAKVLEIDVKSCVVCGWNKTNCDIHRIKHGKDGGKYEKNNVIVVCPNCHRLIHRGLLLL